MKHTREHNGKGTIVGFIPAMDFDSPLTCTLELTDVPQYSIVELVVNRYVLPSDDHCNCTPAGYSRCNYITVTISNNDNRLCSPTTNPVYRYKSDNNVIRILSTRNNQNHAVNFNLTYRGECYNFVSDKSK